MQPLTRVRRARKRRDTANTEWQDAIREAVAAGESIRKVGEAANVSHVRVLQIVRG